MYKSALLFSTNAFSANAFSLNVLSTFTAIYSQFIVNTKTSFHTFIKENKYLKNDIGFIRIKPMSYSRYLLPLIKVCRKVVRICNRL